MSELQNFMDCKGLVNKELSHNFTYQFKRLLHKYESLVKQNTFYKKIQKVNFIKTPENDDTILNLLNKITKSNFQIICEKILFKVTSYNIRIFIDQILLYVDKSAIDQYLLWNLITMLYDHSESSLKTKKDIIQQLHMYIEQFFINFNDCDTSKDLNNEKYIEFLDRNASNKIICNRMKMIYEIVTSERSSLLNYDLNIIYSLLIDKLNVILMTQNMQGDYVYNLLHCIHIIVEDPLLSKNPYAYKKFKNMFGNDIYKKLTNKQKFKLLDIFDIIDKQH